MSKPSIGFEEDVEIAKSEIARIQLVEAISLFLQGKYLCSVTLAGAAEAVFAGILEDEGIPSIVDESVAAIQAIREQTKLSPMGGTAKNKIFNEWNAARNEMKHHGKGKAETISINMFDSAYWMIRRALANAEKLATPVSNAQEFENWIVLNINL